MSLSFILLQYGSKLNHGFNSNGYYPVDTTPVLILFGFLVIPLLILILASVVDWYELRFDSYNIYLKYVKGKMEVYDTPLGLKYILLNFGIKLRNIKKIYLFHRGYLKKVDTYFAYEIVTEKETFHIYFDEIDGEKSWFIYKKNSFNNKPLRIRNNYYNILEEINNKLFKIIKSNFHKRLKEQSFSGI